MSFNLLHLLRCFKHSGIFLHGAHTGTTASEKFFMLIGCPGTTRRELKQKLHFPISSVMTGCATIFHLKPAQPAKKLTLSLRVYTLTLNLNLTREQFRCEPGDNSN